MNKFIQTQDICLLITNIYPIPFNCHYLHIYIYIYIPLSTSYFRTIPKQISFIATNYQHNKKLPHSSKRCLYISIQPQFMYLTSRRKPKRTQHYLKRMVSSLILPTNQSVSKWKCTFQRITHPGLQQCPSLPTISSK